LALEIAVGPPTLVLNQGHAVLVAEQDGASKSEPPTPTMPQFRPPPPPGANPAPRNQRNLGASLWETSPEAGDVLCLASRMGDLDNYRQTTLQLSRPPQPRAVPRRRAGQLAGVAAHLGRFVVELFRHRRDLCHGPTLNRAT
jgi:hypothetical protein